MAAPSPKLTPAQAQALVLLITVARSYSWVTEDKARTNHGEAVNEFLRLTGFPSGGQPWCAAYLMACGHWALPGAWPLPMTASCDVLLEFARSKGILYDAPEPGDIMLLLHNPHDAYHAALVLDVLVNQQVRTIEGNTNADGAREGYKVVPNKIRDLVPGQQTFVRWRELLA